MQRLIKNGLVWDTNQNHEMTPHQQQLSTHQHTHRNTITHFLWLVRKATLNYWLRLKHIKFIIWRWKSICVLARQPDESTKLMFYLLWQPCMFRQIVTRPGLCQASRDCLSSMGWVLIKWLTKEHQWFSLELHTSRKLRFHRHEWCKSVNFMWLANIKISVKNVRVLQGFA